MDKRKGGSRKRDSEEKQPPQPPPSRWKKAGADPLSPVKKSPPVFDVHVAKTKSGDMLLTIQGPNGSYPFTYSFEVWWDNHPKDVERLLHLSHHFHRRDPENPHVPQQTMNNSGYRKYMPVYLNVVSLENVNKNTPANRKKFAQAFCHMYNSHNIQKLFTFENRARYVGDITPQDETKASPLSHFLTIEDTMRIAIGALPTETGLNDLTPLQALDHPAIDYYFGPEVIPIARTFYQPETTNHNSPAHAGADAQQNEEGDEAFEAFAYD